MFDTSKEQFESCERMYNSTFRTEKLEIDFSDMVLVYELRKDVGAILFLKSINESCVPDDEDEYELFLSDLYEFISCNSFEIKNELMKHTHYVELCNYKGEEEGYALYEYSKNIPIFVDKNTSYFQVNK